jgi:ATPase subunit of ABC transporter with duplicated ATPase domains
MRLVSATIRGVGRLVDTTIKVDQKLVAIVGPNEAGKSTLLKALSLVESSESLPRSERSRAGDPIRDDDTIITLRLVVEDADRDTLADLGLAEQPRQFEVTRSAEGKRKYTITPMPRTDDSPVLAAAEELIHAVDRVTHLDLTEKPDDGDPAAIESAQSEAASLLSDLREYTRVLNEFCAADPDERQPGQLPEDGQGLIERLG